MTAPRYRTVLVQPEDFVHVEALRCLWHATKTWQEERGYAAVRAPQRNAAGILAKALRIPAG